MNRHLVTTLTFSQKGRIDLNETKFIEVANAFIDFAMIETHNLAFISRMPARHYIKFISWCYPHKIVMLLSQPLIFTHYIVGNEK